MDGIEDAIFKSSSSVYYWSAHLFPRGTRRDVGKLYSFLRITDNYVDHVPMQTHHFRMLRSHWEHAKDDAQYDTVPAADDTVDERVLKNIVGLTHAYAFDVVWVEAFWDAMQTDLDGKQYPTLEDSLGYVYGSAEVVGLMMAKIMGLAPEAYETAQLQGRAFQWINFIRDIAEDTTLGRCYFPLADLTAAGLKDLQEETARTHPVAFKQLMHHEIARYRKWQAAAQGGFRYLPGMFKPALKTAVDMYAWTADQIAKDPFVVFERKVKPAKSQILQQGVRNLLHY